jgi:hypothetical protein
MGHAVIRTRAVLIATLLLAAAGVPAVAATYLILPGGSGDYPNIQAAIDAASDTDIIELGDGTFAGDGNRDIDFLGKAVTVRSQSGDPGACVLECGGNAATPHRGFIFQSGEGPASVLQDITISNAHHHEASTPMSGGAAVFCDGASPTISGCVFGSNAVDGTVATSGGSILCTGASAPAIIDCIITNSSAGEAGGGNGGAIACLAGADATITGTTIEGNYADGRGGGVYASGADVTLSGCTIKDNAATEGAGAYLSTGTFVMAGCDFLWNEATGAGVGGGLHAADGSFEMSSCTVMGNLATVSGGGVFFGDAATGSVTRTIVAYSILGEGIYAAPGSREAPVVSCCDVFENASGNYGGDIADQTGVNDNISEAPKFCDAPGGDVSIYNTSPCSPWNSPCDLLIGSSEVGCIDDPVKERSWGDIKSSFE